MLHVPLKISLNDGKPILIRPVRPEDKPLLEIGFANLSDRSRYFRFLRPIARLSDKDLAYLTKTQGPDHRAFGALDLAADALPVGIARYIRLLEEPATAEFAVTVVDIQQGRGLGSLLIGMLAADALSNGVDTFLALVHADNVPMIRLLRGLGASMSPIGGAERELRLPINRDPASYPETPVGDAVRCAYRLVDAASAAGPSSKQ